MERWNITHTAYKVSNFLSWQRNGSLELSPSFQRRPVWSPSAKSYLIDTIVRGLPIPVIFIREHTDLSTLEPKSQIVDGQQRIRTLLSYIAPKSLPDYQKSRDFFQVRRLHNSELAGKNFNDLSAELRQRILDYKFGVHVLPSSIDDKEVLKIFARMNATGVKLNGQELRNAYYFGEFKESMYNLAYEQLPRWRRWGIFSENNIARMDEVELTSDLVLLMYQGISTKSKPALDHLYESKDDNFSEKSVVENRFRNVMDSIDDCFNDDLRNLEFRKKTLFYCLFAIVFHVHYTIGSKFTRSKKQPLPSKFYRTMCDISDSLVNKKAPQKVLDATTRRTSIITERKEIFNYMKKKIIYGQKLP